MQISIRNLEVDFPVAGGQMLPALGPVSVKVETGQFVALVGPSGCGKSTLIRVLAGLEPFTRGDVRLDDTAVMEPHPRVGLMFQDSNLMPWRTVRDNVALPLELSGMAEDKRYAAVDGLLQGLGLEGFALSYPGQLSGGMAQRVAFARLLTQKPQLLLLDEPFGALDAMTREQVSMDLLDMWASTRATVLMVTHDINEAVLLSDRVLVFSARPGQIVNDIAVSLARPRRLADSYTPEFAALAQAVRQSITG